MSLRTCVAILLLAGCPWSFVCMAQQPVPPILIDGDDEGIPDVPALEPELADGGTTGEFGGESGGAVVDEALEHAAQLAADEEYQMLRLLADAVDQVERNYVRPISRRELIEAAIDGVLGKLDDYSDYYDPEDWAGLRQAVESQYDGIGIQVAGDPATGYVRVVSPIAGSPAHRAGVLAGDLIVAVDGQDIGGKRLGEVIEMLKGSVGTTVRLTLVHPHDGSRQEVAVERQVVRLETVLGYQRKADQTWDYFCDPDRGIAYVHLTAFSPHTAEDLERVVKQVVADGAHGLILDLRFNPGGLLTAAVDVADLFLSDGLIVTTQGRNVPKQEWRARSEGTFAELKLAVLVNRFSASASEVVAASLQDHQRAVIIGERTWGKASVQNLIELENGRGGLKLTTASYYRPSGKNIHRFEGQADDEQWGVRPCEGMTVGMTLAELSALQQWRRQNMILAAGHGETAGADPSAEHAADPPADPQLERAIEYLGASD